MEIVRAHPEQAAELTRIAIASKAHWGYPAKWLQLWTPLLTITAEYIRQNEVWTILIGQATAGFYSLTPGPAGKVFLDHMWVLPAYIGQGAGRQLFAHALSRGRELGYQVIQAEAAPKHKAFMNTWEPARPGHIQPRWTASNAPCRSWRWTWTDRPPPMTADRSP